VSFTIGTLVDRDADGLSSTPRQV